MRLRNNKNANNELINFDKYIPTKEKLLEILKSNKKNICIEIGMGKGDFISKLSSLNQDNIYIGIELSETILALAAKKINNFEIENNIKLNNLYVMSFDAKELLEYFENIKIDRIYLNFSDPWPKNKHEKRRLTYKDFLELYKQSLKDNGQIEIKTDNRKFFEYTIYSVNNFGFKIKEVFLDLHKENVDNIMTEYERKFCEKGPIYKIVIY